VAVLNSIQSIGNKLDQEQTKVSTAPSTSQTETQVEKHQEASLITQSKVEEKKT
jgi:hypothetical protein